MIEASYQKNQLHGLFVKFVFAKGKTVGQTTVYYMKGKKHGIYTEMSQKHMYYFGELPRVIEDFYSTGTYFHGKKTGIWKTYGKNQLIAQEDYFDDKLHGKTFHYDPITDSCWAQTFQHDKKNGSWNQYHHGTLVQSMEYSNDERNGVAKYFTQEGKLSIECLYQNDQLHGFYRVYD